MIRAEVKFEDKGWVFYEATLEAAKAYVAALEENGVVVVAVEYFDKETREAAIAAGEV